MINLSDGTKINSTRYNNGIKIDAREGAPVVASESGTVDKTDTFKYYGKTIIIKHGRGYMTVYSYLKEIKVKEGEMVKRGEQIAPSERWIAAMRHAMTSAAISVKALMRHQNHRAKRMIPDPAMSKASASHATVTDSRNGTMHTAHSINPTTTSFVTNM